MTLGTGKNFQTGFLGNNYSYATPVQLSTDFVKDTIALSLDDSEIDGLTPAHDFSPKKEKNKFTIPKDMDMFQVPIILQLLATTKACKDTHQTKM